MPITAGPITISNVFQMYYDATIPAIVFQVYSQNTASWNTSFQIDIPNGLLVANAGDQVPVSAIALATSYTTPSTTLVATGHSTSLVSTSGRIEVLGSLTLQNSTANDGCGVAIYRTMGSAPAAGAAYGSSDTKVWQNATTHIASGQNQNVGFDFVDTGLVVGTTYTYYVVLEAITAGTAKEVGNDVYINASTIELQNI